MSFARFLTQRRKKLIEAQEEDQHAYVGCNEEKSTVAHGDQVYVPAGAIPLHGLHVRSDIRAESSAIA